MHKTGYLGGVVRWQTKGIVDHLLILGFSVFSLAVAAAEPSPQINSPIDAVMAGTPDLNLRWRYEHVDDEGSRNGRALKHANASTVRAAFGFRTAELRGFQVRLQFEAIGAVGVDDYADGSGVSNNRFATVVDPEGTELNEAYLAYRHGDMLSLKAGRQNLTYRRAPFHRFIGNVLWRQNWQAFDALRIELRPQEKLTINYAYSWNINRIFGEDAREPLSDFDSDSHLINIRYSGLPWLQLETYAYLLDFDNAARFSSNTYGFRMSGQYALTSTWHALYAGEYAYQESAAGNPATYDDDYLLIEGGFKRAFEPYLKAVTLKFSYEVLGGSGSPNGAFVTVLGTNHAYQGWADRFLVTPDDGIVDRYLTLVMSFAGNLKLILSAHDLDADNGDYDYGREWDVLLAKTFFKHYQLGVKAALYDTERGSRNRVGGAASDVTKLWLWGQMSF